MQNNPNNPYDEVFNNLAKIVDELVRNMPEVQHARIIGYTIVTRHPSGDPAGFGTAGDNDSGEVPYEVLETDSHIFVTAELPPDPVNAPYADIQSELVRICIDNRITVINLSQRIDVIHSTYRVHRGVMDITLRKVPQY